MRLKKQLTKFDINWNQKYLQLKDYKRRFRTCDVPQEWAEDKSLGRWVIRQRVYKKRLTPERIEKLDKLGFTWKIYDKVWEYNYKALIKYKERYGDCNVSKAYSNYLKLADWIQKQRQDRKKKKSRLTKYKINKLNTLGFDWQLYTRPGWDNQYEDLVRFKNKYGHCRVKQGWDKNLTLANWVSIQRRDKKLLTKKQINKLNAIGFIWSIKPRKINQVLYQGRKASI